MRHLGSNLLRARRCSRLQRCAAAGLGLGSAGAAIVSCSAGWRRGALDDVTTRSTGLVCTPSRPRRGGARRRGSTSCRWPTARRCARRVLAQQQRLRAVRMRDCGHGSPRSRSARPTGSGHPEFGPQKRLRCRAPASAEAAHLAQRPRRRGRGICTPSPPARLGPRARRVRAPAPPCCA